MLPSTNDLRLARSGMIRFSTFLELIMEVPEILVGFRIICAYVPPGVHSRCKFTVYKSLKSSSFEAILDLASILERSAMSASCDFLPALRGHGQRSQGGFYENEPVANGLLVSILSHLRHCCL